MKKLNVILITFVMFSSSFYSQDAGILINLHDAKKAVKEYYSSGQYEKEIEKNVNDALLNLSQLEVSNNSAFVFDVDETALSNMLYETKYDYGFIPQYWDEWVESAVATAIPATKRFYDSLVSKNIKIIFITGRSVKSYDKTYKNLVSQGYHKFDTLICKASNFKGQKAVEYKSQTRKELSAKYKIIGSIGDQWSDLEGGWTILKVKLPNYLYFIE